MPSVVEVRCPLGPKRLFTKLRLGEESGSVRYLPQDNVIEFSCQDCSGRLSKTSTTRQCVFHRYNFIGELVETVVTTRS